MHTRDPRLQLLEPLRLVANTRDSGRDMLKNERGDSGVVVRESDRRRGGE